MIAFSGLTEFYEARGGELSPEPDCSFQNWDARIHVSCTGCIPRPFHSCDMLRRLREVPRPAPSCPRPAHRGLIRGQRRYVVAVGHGPR